MNYSKITTDMIENMIIPTSLNIDDDFANSNWRKLRLLCFDFETTGVEILNQANTRVVQVYGQQILGSGPMIQDYGTLINPKMKIPKEVSLIHHIYDEDVADSPTIDEVLPMLYKIVTDSDILIAYNGLTFDLPLMIRDFATQGYDISRIPPMIDPLVWYRHINDGKYSKSRQTDAAAHYKIFDQLSKVAHGESSLHDAKTDVDLLVAILVKMMGGDIPWNLGRVLNIQRELFLKQCVHRTKQFQEPPFDEWLTRFTDVCNGVDYES
jgi:DNA polymerase III epsilon subunit-like protein